MLRGVSFHFVWVRPVAAGRRILSVQREMALTAELIAQEVRNAVALELLDAPPVHPEGGWRCIYRDSAARAVVRVDETGQAVRLGGDLIEALTFQLLRTDNGDNLLRFRVVAAVGGQRYELFSDVLLNNLLVKEPLRGEAGGAVQTPAVRHPFYFGDALGLVRSTDSGLAVHVGRAYEAAEYSAGFVFSAGPMGSAFSKTTPGRVCSSPQPFRNIGTPQGHRIDLHNLHNLS